MQAFTYSILIRDRILQFMQALPFFATNSFKYHTNKALQIQPENIPFAAVYFIEEISLPDGDANVGDVRFRTTARYGISVIIQNNNPDTSEILLDKAMNSITSMFKNPNLYNWDGGADEAKIQAFIRGARSHQFGSIGAENEMPVAELRYDLTVDLGAILFDPPVTDDFITFHVETRYPPGVDANVQQIIAQYDIPQGIQHKISAHLFVKANAVVVHP